REGGAIMAPVDAQARPRAASCKIEQIEAAIAADLEKRQPGYVAAQPLDQRVGDPLVAQPVTPVAVTKENRIDRHHPMAPEPRVARRRHQNVVIERALAPRVKGFE